jgi:hypothetical protein
MTPPALPPSSGPNPQRARFLLELAGALEFLALFHSLPAPLQDEARAYITGLASQAKLK